MSTRAIAAPRYHDVATVARLGAWAFVAVSFALFLADAGSMHFSPNVVCHFPPGTPCTLVGYGVSDLVASLPAFILWSGVLPVVAAERLAHRLGEMHVPLRRLVALSAVLLTLAAVLFYGFGLVRMLFVAAWHVEHAYFVTNVTAGLLVALGLGWLSVRLRDAA